jgi:hypothetical protein
MFVWKYELRVNNVLHERKVTAAAFSALRKSNGVEAESSIVAFGGCDNPDRKPHSKIISDRFVLNIFPAPPPFL